MKLKKIRENRFTLRADIESLFCLSGYHFHVIFTASELLPATVSDLPKDYNVYVEHVLETVLEPVLEGVNKLKLTTQLGVVSMATVAICDAWIAFIMKEKIKFR